MFTFSDASTSRTEYVSMSSRESSLGAWADKIPRVDGWSTDSDWKDEPIVEESPLTPEDLAHEFKQIGILFLLGLAPILLAAALVAKDWHILTGERTTGTIVELRGGQFPVARFHVDGQNYVVTSSYTNRSRIYHVGDTVNVRYSPDDPHQAVIVGLLHHYLGPILLAGFGSIFVLLAVGCGVYVVCKSKSPEPHVAA
jgi:hypothetical protein